MDRRIERDKEHLALSVAAAIAHHQVTGTTASIAAPADLDAALNRAARALASLTEIYAQQGGVIRVLPLSELLEGVFLRGATVFRSADGHIHTRLTVPRGALREAINILKAAAARDNGSSFRQP